MTLAAVLLAVLATLSMAAATRELSRANPTIRLASLRKRGEETVRHRGLLLLSVACGAVAYGLAREAGLGVPAALGVSYAGPVLVALLAAPLHNAARRSTDRR